MRICLTMIVRNEAHVIRRCLESVAALIDCWCLCDNGSTDYTQVEIDKVLYTKGSHPRPGNIVLHQWHDFGINRTLALREAERMHRLGPEDYHLVVDADDLLVSAQDVTEVGLSFSPYDDLRDRMRSQGAMDAYYLQIDDCGQTYQRLCLLRADGGWVFRSPVHEFADRPGARLGSLSWPRYHRIGGGDRSRDPERYLKDANLLESAIEAEPYSDLVPRWLFYLGQSYRDARSPGPAWDAYHARFVDQRGWREERYVAALRMHELRANGFSEERLKDAWRLNPHRAEAPFQLATVMAQRGEDEEALLWATYAASLTPPNDAFLSDPQVYAWSRNLSAQLKGLVSIKGAGNGLTIARAAKIEGWMSIPELLWLADHAGRCESVVEIGSWMGRSAVAMACNTKGRVYCVDTWDGTEEDHRELLEGKPPDWLFEEFKRNIDGIENIEWMRYESTLAAEILSCARFDMVFIDGDHSEESVRADIEAWTPLLKPGGIMCGHDFDWPSVASAVTDLLPSYQRGAGSIWVARC